MLPNLLCFIVRQLHFSRPLRWCNALLHDLSKESILHELCLCKDPLSEQQTNLGVWNLLSRISGLFFYLSASYIFFDKFCILLKIVFYSTMTMKVTEFFLLPTATSSQQLSMPDLLDGRLILLCFSSSIPWCCVCVCHLLPPEFCCNISATKHLNLSHCSSSCNLFEACLATSVLIPTLWGIRIFIIHFFLMYTYMPEFSGSTSQSFFCDMLLHRFRFWDCTWTVSPRPGCSPLHRSSIPRRRREACRLSG
jgi:hypothetical protein